MYVCMYVCVYCGFVNDLFGVYVLISFLVHMFTAYAHNHAIALPWKAEFLHDLRIQCNEGRPTTISPFLCARVFNYKYARVNTHLSVVAPGLGSGRRTGKHQLPRHEKICPLAEERLIIEPLSGRSAERRMTEYGCHPEFFV